MVAEIFGGISAFQGILNSLKGLKDMNDAAVRGPIVVELTEKILGAQAAQTALLDQIRELKEKITSFETWNAEKQQYDLKDLGWNAFAYMLKPDARGTNPPHWVCTNCYGNKRISLVQRVAITGQGMRYRCPACKSDIDPSPQAFEGGRIKWMD